MNKLLLEAVDNVKVFPSDLILCYYKNCDRRLADRDARRRLIRSFLYRDNPQPVAAQGDILHYHIKPDHAKDDDPSFYVVTKGKNSIVNCTCADFNIRLNYLMTTTSSATRTYPCKHGWRVLRLEYDTDLIRIFSIDNLIKLVTSKINYHQMEDEMLINVAIGG